MELLPIIYWSLTGFGILTLMVILTSYLTYHIRKKLGNIPSEAFKNEYRNKDIRKKNPDKSLSGVKQHHPRVVRRKFHHDDQKDPRQKSRDRITILNDLLKEDNSNYNRFRKN